MQYVILCVGKMKERYFSEAIAEYQKRLSRYGKLEVVEVPDEKTPDSATEAENDQIKKREAERLKKHLREHSYTIALDIQGKEYDSLGFAQYLGQQMIHGNSQITFLIGGSLGLHSSLLREADARISFSKMTFPHQLMRVILLEQIYRAHRILKGEPYHK